MLTTLSLPEAARLLGVGRTTAYKAAAEGTFPVPVLRTGKRRYTVPVAPLLEALGLEELPEGTTSEGGVNQ